MLCLYPTISCLSNVDHCVCIQSAGIVIEFFREQDSKKASSISLSLKQFYLNAIEAPPKVPYVYDGKRDPEAAKSVSGQRGCRKLLDSHILNL